jgi:hypothetical protein
MTTWKPYTDKFGNQSESCFWSDAPAEIKSKLGNTQGQPVENATATIDGYHYRAKKITSKAGNQFIIVERKVAGSQEKQPPGSNASGWQSYGMNRERLVDFQEFYSIEQMNTYLKQDKQAVYIRRDVLTDAEGHQRLSYLTARKEQP